MNRPVESYDAIILGAGGAGLMCAAIAGHRGRRILLIDHADAPGKKILISGGGRCNFTNLNTAADRFISANPHFAKSALGRYRPEDFIALVDAHGIAWHEKTLGQLFCDGSARQIVTMLLDECAKGRVDLALGQPVAEIDHADGVFRVRHGARIASAPALVIATGGPSIPKLGATGFAYDLARRFGLKVVEPRPALVPLTLWFVGSAIFMVGADLPTFKAWVGGYGNPVLLILVTVALYHHAQLGLSVIIEDYVHGEGAKLALLPRSDSPAGYHSWLTDVGNVVRLTSGVIAMRLSVLPHRKARPSCCTSAGSVEKM